MKSNRSIDALTWLGGLAAQTFLKALLVLLLLSGLIDLVVIRRLDLVPARYFVIAGLAASLFLAWVFLLWKTEPSIMPRSILAVIPLLIGIGAFLATGSFVWWWVVIAGYIGVGVWWVFFRAPALGEARQQWRAGNTEQAIGTLDQFIKSHPNASEAYQYRAWFRVEQAQYSEAERDIQTSLRLKPKSYFSHYVKGRVLVGKGRLREAAESLQTAVQLGPGRGISYLPLGIIYHLEAEPLLAVQALYNSIGWGLPNASYTFVAYYYLGRSLAAADQYIASARAFELMAKHWKGYHMLVNSIKTDNRPETPIEKLYREDLPDMERRLNLAGRRK